MGRKLQARLLAAVQEADAQQYRHAARSDVQARQQVNSGHEVGYLARYVKAKWMP
jgi:hypothetical protein